MIEFKDIKFDCRYFRGDIPCKPHKNHKVHCINENGTDCKYYEKIEKRILIIKLGATGDVIRTTPLVTRVKEEYPHSKIYWLTLTPDVIPDFVDEVLNPEADKIIYLQSLHFDLAINLDKDKEACGLMNSITADVKKGFILKNGVPYPADENAKHKFFTGIFDSVSQLNTKNYLEEIFEICGYKYKGEKYILSAFKEFEHQWSLNKSKKVIGLNTGCGGRWTSRLWPNKNWVDLIRMLRSEGYEVLLLGGKLEHDRNKDLSDITGATYLGHLPLKQFINLVDQCSLVVTGVTMAMHVAIGLEKKLVLFNNIFNKNEFELFGLGEIIEPSKECKCFYSAKCTNEEYVCMNYIETGRVFDTIQKLLA